jgi:unsaturated rhamnogalacturonyl hydrolase
MLRLLNRRLCLLLVTTTTVLAQSNRLTVPYGVTRTGTVLNSQLHPSLLDVDSPLTRILVIAAREADATAASSTATLLRSVMDVSAKWSTEFPEISVSVIASPYPDDPFDALGLTSEFPPTGSAYDDAVHPEAIYLWRWIGMLAPDVLIEVRAGQTQAWTKPTSNKMDFDFSASLSTSSEAAAGTLPAALANHAACDVATIPTLSLVATTHSDLVPLLKSLQQHPMRSAAREELSRRRNRSPLDVAQLLSRTHGHQLNEVAYIPALSLIARLRLGDLTGDASQRRDIERMVQPYYSGQKPSLPPNSNQSQQAGNLIFGELAAVTKDSRYVALLRQAADVGFDREGRNLEVMPSHSEMSDAIFLGTPLLAQTARLTGDSKYREMALRHLRFMVKLNRRPDGLHRHSPLNPEHTAWGRGNGFVALGLALTLSELPPDSAEFGEVLGIFREHLGSMLPHQDQLGMWHQVIDHPESYREFTVTCMTTMAIARGIRRGWFDRTRFEPVVQRAWRSIKQRIATDGGLVDVCTGTGKMKSLREYLDRPAILGRDDRGGAMALLLSTELACAEREAQLPSD